MPSARKASRGGGIAARLAGAAAVRLWVWAVRRPVDSFAVLGASFASAVIIVNALFLQKAAPPSPFIANPPPPSVAASLPVPDATAAARPAEPKTPTPEPATPHIPPAQPVSAHGGDPIGEFITTSSRVVAVQRILSRLGYGKLKASGVLDKPTSSAIEKFERDHKLPVSGRLSDRLVGELAAMAGHPIE